MAAENRMTTRYAWFFAPARGGGPADPVATRPTP